MKYRRKPVVRTTVDALKGDDCYIVQLPNGAIDKVAFDVFEADYEPVRRERVAKVKKPRKVKDQPVTP